MPLCTLANGPAEAELILGAASRDSHERPVAQAQRMTFKHSFIAVHRKNKGQFFPTLSPLLAFPATSCSPFTRNSFNIHIAVYFIYRSDVRRRFIDCVALFYFPLERFDIFLFFFFFFAVEKK